MKLNSFSAFSHLMYDSLDPFFIDRSQSGDGKAESDEASFFRDIESFGLQIGTEATVRATRDF